MLSSFAQSGMTRGMEVLACRLRYLGCPSHRHEGKGIMLMSLAIFRRPCCGAHGRLGLVHVRGASVSLCFKGHTEVDSMVCP